MVNGLRVEHGPEPRRRVGARAAFLLVERRPDLYGRNRLGQMIRPVVVPAEEGGGAAGM